MAERIIIDQTEVEQQIQDNRDGDNVVTWNWDNADVNDIYKQTYAHWVG